MSACTDDLRGLSREEQIARVKAEARAEGDDLDDAGAARVLDMYATWTPGARVISLRTVLEDGITDGEPTVCIPRAVAQQATELARQRRSAQIPEPRRPLV